MGSTFFDMGEGAALCYQALEDSAHFGIVDSTLSQDAKRLQVNGNSIPDSD
jgi:hypothetical protein